MILRVVAVLIALAGLADPVFRVTRPVRQPLTITILDTASLALPDGGETRRARAYRSATALVAGLEGDYAATVREQSIHSTADPCPSEGACIIVSDGARPRVLHSGSRVLAGVRVGAPMTPNVAIRAIDAPAESNLNAIAALEVHLEARGAGGTTTTLQALDGDVVLGSASYLWPASKEGEHSEASLRVEWVPLAPGTREVRVVASGQPHEATLVDNEARAWVQVVARRFNVLVYEPQPSWASAFLRRALDGDPRFNVMVRARLGPRHSAGSTTVPLTAEALEQQDVRTVVVSAPQLLAEGEIEALERLVKLRGASLVVLLDAPPVGKLSRLLHATGIERREPRPLSVGTLKASELIVLRPRSVATRVMAAAGQDPVVIATALGQGHVVASGAADAWRYRADGGFDSFWRSMVAEATEAVGDPLILTLSPAVAATVGTPVEVDAEWRSVRDAPGSLHATGVLQCGDEAMPIRLLPSGRPGRFRGELEPPAQGDCTVTVAVEPLATATAPLRIVEMMKGPVDDRDRLFAAVRAHGGTMVEAGDERRLVSQLRAVASPQRASVPVRPTRSPWWIVPFVACLGGEWWLRRRRGLL